jgi:hypothetical protein
MTLDISTIADLDRATHLASWLQRPRVHAVLVELPWVPPDERRRVDRTAARYFNDCGCFWGMPAFVTVLLTCQMWAPWFESRWLGFGVSLLVSVEGALAGKLAGLAWSRWRLTRLLQGLRSRSLDAS